MWPNLGIRVLFRIRGLGHKVDHLIVSRYVCEAHSDSFDRLIKWSFQTHYLTIALRLLTPKQLNGNYTSSQVADLIPVVHANSAVCAPTDVDLRTMNIRWLILTCHGKRATLGNAELHV